MHRTDRRYIVTLALVAAGILSIGSFLRPRQLENSEPVPGPGPSQAELSRLARLSQRRSLDSMTDYFAGVARDVEASVVELPGLGRSGLVWSPGLVLTARAEWRFPDAVTLSTPSGEVGVATVAAGPHLPLAALRISDAQDLEPPTRQTAAFLGPGTWTVAVWRHPRRGRASFTPAHFLGLAPRLCAGHPVSELQSSVTWTPAMAGGGLFDLDGHLVAVILPCDGRYAAIAVDDVDTLIGLGQSLEGRLLRRFGLRLENLTEAEATHLGHAGVVVREIWTGHLADTAGLMPGDVLVAINAELIGRAEQLEPLVEAAEIDRFEVAVYRQGELMTVELLTDPMAIVGPGPADAVAGLHWGEAPVGLLIDAVVPDSQADVAGIEAGDRLRRVDGLAPAHLDAVHAALSDDREAPVILELERAGRRWVVLLP